MKKVFVKPEMKSHRLRGGNLLSGSECPTDGDIGGICLKEIEECKKEGFGCPDGDGQQQWWN